MKKFLPYIFILCALIGFFNLTTHVYAQTSPLGQCKASNNDSLGHITLTECTTRSRSIDMQWEVTWTPDDTTQRPVIVRVAGVQSGTPADTAFEREVYKDTCSMNPLAPGTFYPGCFIWTAYALFYVIPSMLLWVCAYVFNVLVSLTITDTLFRSDFIGSAWAVVRDISNIFFILVLLYIAIKIILDLGSHEAKGLIAKVVVAALLINFSMFFTQVVVDASNVLALIFYNKISVKTTDANGNRDYQPALGENIAAEGSATQTASMQNINENEIGYKENIINGVEARGLVAQSVGAQSATSAEREYTQRRNEKDIAGGLVAHFDPTQLLTSKFFQDTKKVTVYGQTFDNTNQPVAPGILIGISILAGSLMIFAAYCLFVSGFSFLGRLIELWILIIFSPFAFMSYAVPKLGGQDFIGWNSWTKRLITSAFMAPIFMFFLYFIFLIIKANPFASIAQSNGNAISTIIMTVIPTLLIMSLLRKATDYAKKGAGEFGEMVMKGAKLAGGIALGVATGGTSLLATGTLGVGAAKLASSEMLQSRVGNKGMSGWLARKSIQAADYGSKASFDLRRAPGMGALARQGVNMNSGALKALGLGEREKGFKGMEERKAQKLEAERSLYKTKLTDDEVKKMSAEKRAAYEAEKAAAKERAEAAGRTFDEKDYDKVNKPEDLHLESAEDLNHYRLKQFADNLGLEGILGSAVYTALKAVSGRDGSGIGGGIINKGNFGRSNEYIRRFQEKHKRAPVEGEDYDAALANDINKERAKKAKMQVGGAMAVVAGAFTGGTALGAMGAGAAAQVAAVAAGAAVGGTGAASYSNRDNAGEKKFAKGLEKQFKEMKNVEDRLHENTNALKDLHEFLGGANSLVAGEVDEDGNPIKLVTGDKSKGFKVDTEKVERELAKLVFINKKDEIRLKQLVEKKDRTEAEDEEIRRLENSFMQNTIKMNKLNTLKTTPDKERDLRKKIYDLHNDKEKIEKEHAEHAKHAAEAGKKKDSGAAHPKPDEHKKEHKEEHPEPAHPEPSGGGGEAHGHH